MALASNIVRRAGSKRYYARVNVPRDLQAKLGKKEIWRSLNTADPREARSKGALVVAEFEAEFDDLRQRHAPTAGDLQDAVWDHYQGELERDRQERMALPMGADIAEAKDQLAADIESGKVQWSDDPLVQLSATIELQAMANRAGQSREARVIRIAALRRHLATGETALIAWAADEVIKRDGLEIVKGTAAYRDLCQRLQRADLEVLQRAEERDLGDWSGKPKDDLIQPPPQTVESAMAAPGESIMELFDRFARKKAGAATADTWEQNRKIVKLYAEFVGETAHISAVNRKGIRDWKAALRFWPVRAHDTKLFKDFPFPAVIEKNKVVGKATINDRTINKYLAAIGSFSGWLRANDYITEHVTDRMYLSVSKREKTRLPFTMEQLVTLFGSPLFVGFLRDGKEHKPGNVSARDWRYWVPLISLFTGARLGEIAQLFTDDVRQLHNVWVFHVTREGSRLGFMKSTKSEGSQRVVPMHSELIKLGFIDYVTSVTATGSPQLFPEIKPDKRGFFSGAPSKFYQSYFKRIGIKTDDSVNFHSFRHGIADAFRRAGYVDEQFGMLLGHTRATTTGRYGILPPGVLADRVKMIEAVSFPKLDLSHLHPA